VPFLPIYSTILLLFVSLYPQPKSQQSQLQLQHIYSNKFKHHISIMTNMSSTFSKLPSWVTDLGYCSPPSRRGAFRQGTSCRRPPPSFDLEDPINRLIDNMYYTKRRSTRKSNSAIEPAYLDCIYCDLIKTIKAFPKFSLYSNGKSELQRTRHSTTRIFL
jgi:hypothetical protein